MNLKKIKKIVQHGESTQVELKRSTGVLHATFETVCAFLNSKGGAVLIGVTDDGRIVGQDIADHTKQEIAAHIAKIEPSAQSLIEVEYVPIENGKKVICITVNQGKYCPYVYDGRAFYRNESTTSKMAQHGYEQLLIARGSLDYSWEKQSAISCDINSLDHEEIRRTVAKGVKNKRIPSDALDESIKKILTNRFDLILNNGSLKNAAAVLFGKNTQSTYPQCLIKMGRFKNADDLGGFIDNQQFYGNAFQILSAADNFVTKHLAIASFFDENSFERKDEPTVPVLALREAFINAITHRDYSNRAASIYLSIFDGHLEIWNNGTLPRQLKIDDLKKSHKSYPRNELIAKIFFNRGLVESWGKGTNRMIKLCREHNLPDPEFKEYSGGFAVNFKFREPIGVAQRSHPDISKYQLTSRQAEIIKTLASGVRLSSHEIMKQLQNAPAPRTVRDDLTHLKKLKLITLSGFGRGAKWATLERGGKEAVKRR